MDDDKYYYFDFEMAEQMRSVQPGYWKAKTGNILRIKDMDNQHLKNTIRMLERQARTARQKTLGSMQSLDNLLSPDSDGSFILGQHMDAIASREVEDESFLSDEGSKLFELREEAWNRGLEV